MQSTENTKRIDSGVDGADNEIKYESQSSFSNPMQFLFSWIIMKSLAK